MKMEFITRYPQTPFSLGPSREETTVLEIPPKMKVHMTHSVDGGT